MFRHHSRPGPIAIDIGTAGVKMMQIDASGDRPVVSAATWRGFPANVAATDRDAFAVEVISDAIKSGGFRGRRAALALAPREFQIKSFRMPQMPREELAAALQFEAEERFGFGAEAGQYRFVCAGEVRHGTELKEELIVFGVRESVVREHLSRLESLNLEPESVEAAPCAMARSFARFLRRDEDAATVNVFLSVGRSATSMVVTRGAEVAFVKVMEGGGARFDEAVAERLGMSAEQANELRRKVMLSTGRRARDAAAADAVPAAVREQVASALQPAVEQLARDVQLCLRYFAVTFRGQKASSLTFVGGEAHDPVLAERFTEIVQVPCLVGDPLRGMTFAPGVRLPADWTFRPAFGDVAGLALRGAMGESRAHTAPVAEAGAAR